MTGLMWIKDANLAADTKTWATSLTYVTGLNGANSGAGTYGYNEWETPGRV
jgi:hypothetical protein